MICSTYWPKHTWANCLLDTEIMISMISVNAIITSIYLQLIKTKQTNKRVWIWVADNHNYKELTFYTLHQMPIFAYKTVLKSHPTRGTSK